MPAHYSEIKSNLTRLYLEDERPWLVGFSGGKDSSMVASLLFDIVLSLPPEQRTKPVVVLCTDTRVEIPAIVEMLETTLAQMQKCATQNDLPIEIQLLRPPAEQSFWVNVIGRGYPPPNRVFVGAPRASKLIRCRSGLKNGSANMAKQCCIWARGAPKAPRARKRWPSANAPV